MRGCSTSRSLNLAVAPQARIHITCEERQLVAKWCAGGKFWNDHKYAVLLPGHLDIEVVDIANIAKATYTIKLHNMKLHKLGAQLL